MQNRLFVVDKPKGISSNHFLGKIKRKYDVKKAGFSGTLDPFASGCLIVAFNQYTKLFRYLKKAPKKYVATLWLGLKSDTLDIDGELEIEALRAFHPSIFATIFDSFLGELEYVPPKFCAKKIDGKRAYALARDGQDVKLKSVKMQIYSLKLLCYNHPFVTFEAVVSEGAYIRSLGEKIAQKVGVNGSLSALRRVSEGDFSYNNEEPVEAIKYLNIKQNEYLGDEEDVKLGKKLVVSDFKFQENGEYIVSFSEEFAIIKIENGSVKYELNKVKLC